jgi:hypothetical protein
MSDVAAASGGTDDLGACLAAFDLKRYEDKLRALTDGNLKHLRAATETEELRKSTETDLIHDVGMPILVARSFLRQLVTWRPSPPATPLRDATLIEAEATRPAVATPPNATRNGSLASGAGSDGIAADDGLDVEKIDKLAQEGSAMPELEQDDHESMTALVSQVQQQICSSQHLDDLLKEPVWKRKTDFLRSSFDLEWEKSQTVDNKSGYCRKLDISSASTVSEFIDFQKLFGVHMAGPALYNIPGYQRRYAWRIEQCRDLWQDVQLISELTKKVERVGEKFGSDYEGLGELRSRTGDLVHFASTVLLKRAGWQVHAKKACDDKDDHLVVLDVVDGQQRLTTVLKRAGWQVHAKKACDDKDDHLVVLDVVDGQQRLTTVILLLSAIAKNWWLLAADANRSRFEQSTCADQAIRITDEYLFVWHKGTEVRLLRLNVPVQEREYFRKPIDPRFNLGTDGLKPPSDSSAAERMLIAHDFFLKKLQEERERVLRPTALNRQPTIMDWETKLREIYRALTEKFKVILFVAPVNIDPLMMFEAANTRGRPLSSLDYLRVFLLRLADQLSNSGSASMVAEAAAPHEEK